MQVLLQQPQLIEITGPDALAFAHAQFSSDVHTLVAGHWQWSAWLSAQGRVRALFRLLRSGDERLTMILSGGSAAAVRTSLAAYVLRARVQLQVDESSRAFGSFEWPARPAQVGPAPTGNRFVASGPLTALAVPGRDPRWYLLDRAAAAGTAAASTADLDRWRCADIEAGLVQLDAALADRQLPAWLGLDRLDAVSVRKGCYPGQEIVARLHFKGGNKRWLYRLEFETDALPAPATPLDAAADATGGELLNAAWTGAGRGMALAVLPATDAGTTLTSAAVLGATFRVVSAVDRASD